MNSNFTFSEYPGAHERHLIRKFKNPLFPMPDRYPLENEVEQARIRDQEELKQFLGDFEGTIHQTAALESSVDGEILLDIKSKLEQLYLRSSSLAGDLSHHREAIKKLIDVCMASLLAASADDQAVQSKFYDEIEARAVLFQLLESTLVADFLRKDNIIKEDELIATLLSEPESDLPNVMTLFSPEQKEQIVEEAEKLVNSSDEPFANTRFRSCLEKMKVIVAQSH